MDDDGLRTHFLRLLEATRFDEKKIRRDRRGKFADKPATAKEMLAKLDAPAGGPADVGFEMGGIRVLPNGLRVRDRVDDFNDRGDRSLEVLRPGQEPGDLGTYEVEPASPAQRDAIYKALATLSPDASAVDIDDAVDQALSAPSGGPADADSLRPGSLVDQVHQNTRKKIRRVKIVEVKGDKVLVEALNGPMKGTSYELPRSQIAGQA